LENTLDSTLGFWNSAIELTIFHVKAVNTAFNSLRNQNIKSGVIKFIQDKFDYDSHLLQWSSSSIQNSRRHGTIFRQITRVTGDQIHQHISLWTYHFNS